MAVALVSLDKNRGELHSGQPGVLETQTACGRIAVLASGATVEEDWDSWNEARSTCLLTVGKVTSNYSPPRAVLNKTGLDRRKNGIGYSV